MNFSSFIGFVAATAVFWGAVTHSAHNYTILLDQQAMLIVLGGTVAVACISFPLSRVLGMIRVFFRRILGGTRKDYLGLIDEVSALSAANRRGRVAFEAAITKIRDPFLKDAAQVLIWLDAEISVDELRDLLETRAETHFERYEYESNIFRALAKFPPSFGLLGTTLGMIALLQNLGKSDSKNLIGPAMSVALVATLYGIVTANFIFLPIAENLSQQTKEDLIARRIVVEGIMLIGEDKPTQFVEEKVKSFLLPSERGGRGILRPGSRGGGKDKEAA